MVELKELEDAAAEAPGALRESLLPPDRALTGLPEVALGAADAERFRGGQAVPADAAGIRGLVRVYGGAQVFLGVGEIAGDGRVAPRRVFGRPGGTP
jgi:tRNA pseudouridine55 synthase